MVGYESFAKIRKIFQLIVNDLLKVEKYFHPAFGSVPFAQAKTEITQIHKIHKDYIFVNPPYIIL